MTWSPGIVDALDLALTQATAPSSIGAPVAGAGLHPTLANLSASFAAKPLRERFLCRREDVDAEPPGAFDLRERRRVLSLEERPRGAGRAEPT